MQRIIAAIALALAAMTFLLSQHASAWLGGGYGGYGGYGNGYNGWGTDTGWPNGGICAPYVQCGNPDIGWSGGGGYPGCGCVPSNNPTTDQSSSIQVYGNNYGTISSTNSGLTGGGSPYAYGANGPTGYDYGGGDPR